LRKPDGSVSNKWLLHCSKVPILIFNGILTLQHRRRRIRARAGARGGGERRAKTKQTQLETALAELRLTLAERGDRKAIVDPPNLLTRAN